jgi:cell division septation protein DedD
MSKSEDTKSYKYTIQAGAFTVADNANSLKSDLDSAGYFTKVEDKNVAGTSFHIIYVGKFVNQEDAKNFLKLVNNKFNINGRVVSINSK